MAEKEKGRAPGYAGGGMVIWGDTDENENTYLTVRLFGWNVVMMVNRFFTTARPHLFPCYIGTGEGFGIVFQSEKGVLA